MLTYGLRHWSHLYKADRTIQLGQACYTIVIVGINLTAVNLNAYLPPEFLAHITPEQIQNAIYGCKWTFATEVTKLTTVWGCKACLLVLYNHMT